MCQNIAGRWPSLKTFKDQMNTTWDSVEKVETEWNSIRLRTPNPVPAPVDFPSEACTDPPASSPAFSGPGAKWTHEAWTLQLLGRNTCKAFVENDLQIIGNTWKPYIFPKCSKCILFLIRASAASRCCTRMTPMSIRKDQMSQACLSNLLIVTYRDRSRCGR